MKSKRKSKGDSLSENRHMGGVRSPTQCVLGDYIKTPPKQTSLSKDDRVTPPKCATMSTAWEPNIDTKKRGFSTPSSVKDIIGNTSLPNAMATEDLKCQKGEKQIQTVLADQLKVHSQDKLDVLAKIYSECITGKLVPCIYMAVFSIQCWLVGRGEGKKVGRLIPRLRNIAQKIWNSKESGSQRLCVAHQLQMQKRTLIKFVIETLNMSFFFEFLLAMLLFLQLIWF